MKDTQHNSNYSLRELIAYFLKLGTTGFGGPVALVGYMHRDLVENKHWISEEEYKQGLALAQLAPGPLAAQLAIYLGFVHYRILGATLVGLAFVIPSFIMVVILGYFYKLFGGLAWVQAIFYGVGAAVIGIIAVGSYKLTQKSVGQFTWDSLKEKWMLWSFFVIALATTIITKQEQVLLFLAAGILYMLIKAPFKIDKQNTVKSVVFLQVGFLSFETSTLQKIAIFFAKAGAFVFGSGLAIVPFLHAGVVEEYKWLSEKEFLDSVAVAMITPGPVVITVGFIGYLVAGFSGACVAALATFLPCYLFTVLPAPYFNKIAQNQSIKAFVDGITASVVGALVGAVFIIGKGSIFDIPTALIAIVTAVILFKFKKIQELYIILAVSIIGLLLKFYLPQLGLNI
jgi:chromate transporter